MTAIPEATMATPFPHHYEVRVEGGTGGAIMSAPPRPEFRGGPPEQFDGRNDWWSPEHLLLSAAALCLKTTFEAFARRRGLEVLAYGSRVEGALDKTPKGLAFTSIVIDVELAVGAGDATRAEEILRSAKDHCIVSNALKTPVEVVITVKAVAPAQAL
jgi:organic hydroperoxide reductase OsmC/OhrA